MRWRAPRFALVPPHQIRRRGTARHFSFRPASIFPLPPNPSKRDFIPSERVLLILKSISSALGRIKARNLMHQRRSGTLCVCITVADSRWRALRSCVDEREREGERERERGRGGEKTRFCFKYDSFYADKSGGYMQTIAFCTV